MTALLARTRRLDDDVDLLRFAGRDGMLFEHVDLALGRGDRLGVVGVNGSGKSTLLDVVAGRRRPRVPRHGAATGPGVFVAAPPDVWRPPWEGARRVGHRPHHPAFAAALDQAGPPRGQLMHAPTEPIPLAAGYTPLFVKGSGFREHLVELFDVVGPTDERVVKARKALMSALF